MRITRVYTRTGDDGETGLAGGQRVPKDGPRIEAFGTVDELNSQIGVARCLLGAELDGHLEAIQHHLFDIGGDLCVLAADKARFKMEPFPADRTTWLEGVIDELNGGLPELKEFVLPAGEPGAAALHVARCVARRAERRCVTLASNDEVSANVIPYLNRLSDALFVFARVVNARAGRGDVLWNKTHKRDAP
jgi:cob(I)alamin adenosyltransferase